MWKTNAMWKVLDCTEPPSGLPATLTNFLPFCHNEKEENLMTSFSHLNYYSMTVWTALQDGMLNWVLLPAEMYAQYIWINLQFSFNYYFHVLIIKFLHQPRFFQLYCVIFPILIGFLSCESFIICAFLPETKTQLSALECSHAINAILPGTQH